MREAHFNKCITAQKVYNSRAYRALNAKDLTVYQHQLKSEAGLQKLMELCWWKIHEEPQNTFYHIFMADSLIQGCPSTAASLPLFPA